MENSDCLEEVQSQGSQTPAIEAYDDSVANLMDEYLHRGDYLQLKEYLENSAFEKLIENDKKFQSDVVKRMRDLIDDYSFGKKDILDVFKEFLHLLRISGNK